MLRRRLAAIHRDWGEAQGNYDEFRFFTGLRPSEEIALVRLLPGLRRAVRESGHARRESLISTRVMRPASVSELWRSEVIAQCSHCHRFFLHPTVRMESEPAKRWPPKVFPLSDAESSLQRIPVAFLPKYKSMSA